MNSDGLLHGMPVVISVKADAALPELMRRFVTAVPVFPEQRVHEMVAKGSTFVAVLEYLRQVSPSELFIFWRDSVGPFLALAGGQRLGSGFLVGNLRMLSSLFDHDPRVLAFVPFRITLTDDEDGGSWFTAEMPGGGLHALEEEAISGAAPKIDAKLLHVMTVMGLEIPGEAAAQLAHH